MSSRNRNSGESSFWKKSAYFGLAVGVVGGAGYYSLENGFAPREDVELPAELSLPEEIIETTLLSFGFDPAISMTLLTERCIDSVIAIAYDRDLPEEEKRAFQCHDELLTKLMDKGYYPYRLSTYAMGKLPKPEAGYAYLMDKIKDAIDPHHIIAPGRYEEHK